MRRFPGRINFKAVSSLFLNVVGSDSLTISTMISLLRSGPSIYGHLRHANVLLNLQLHQCRCTKTFTTVTNPGARLSRSYLYVPASSDRMLEKSISSNSDVIIYDLEDSVAPSPNDKGDARVRLKKFLEVFSMWSVCIKTVLMTIYLQERKQELKNLHVAVRVNDVTTPFFRDDIAQIVE